MPMDRTEFWTLIDRARSRTADPADAEQVVERASELLAGYPVEEIRAAQQVLWDLLTESYRTDLWGAAYLVNGGCSDDLFDYFRGWLLTRGRDAYEAALADPDALAGFPEIRAAAAGGADVECEDALGLVDEAHRAATGADVPDGAYTVSYPDEDEQGPDWDFDDPEEAARRLPRLTALFADA